MPRSSREKSAETRANILDAAHWLFTEQGYSATSMREISQRAGVTVGAIYNHFATKEDIWKEVLQSKHPVHEIIPMLMAAEGETVSDVVRSAARAMVNELFKRPDLFHLMFIELVEFKARHLPGLLEYFLPRLVGLQSILAGKRGRLRNLPAPILLRSFAGLFFSFYVTGALMKGMHGISDDEASLDQFVDLYLHGVIEEEEPGREDA